MRRAVTIAAVVLSSAGLVAFGTGCGGGDEADVTPADATTIANTAPQTDSEGKTVPAPSSGGGSAEPADSDMGGGGEAGGDIAVGKTVFEANCQGCHPAGGTQAGAGPKLTTSTLSAEQVTSQVVNGKGAMPGGLVSGTDLDNVVAYVVSIQQ